MKVRILINRNARAVRFHRISSTIFRRFLSENVTLCETGSIEEIPQAVRGCWDDDVDVVLLATGDGGLHRYMSAFVDLYRQHTRTDGSVKALPLFATLRTGTANLITGKLGGRGRPRQAIERLFALLRRAQSREDLPRIRQKLLAVSDGMQQRFGFIAGSGVIYNFFTEYYRGARYSLSRFFAIFSHAAVSLFTSGHYLNRMFASMEARLQLDERRETIRRWKLLVVSAIDTRVVFFRAFRLGERVDRLHIKAGNPSRPAIIRNIPNLLFNRRLKGRQLLDRFAAKVCFERDDEFGYTIDGELYNTRKLEIVPGPVVEFVRF